MIEFFTQPLVILVIGIVTVVGLIIWLRLNAFLALISAALVVSLLAPGDIATKISRVAVAFGGAAGNIGIVIALAAVIGKCLMDSGSADRIVRAFLNLLGEKRASFALMGSGFVLAVPVFFDTVFYLLVPLARSLYTRTGKNYLLYIMAIAAGGAITHTLVPPTPGPLIMAATLNVQIGTMILVGAIVAVPAALVGVLCANVADRLMPIPMRQIGTEPEPEPLKDEELPPLWMALLPVLLPVAMISTNTVVSTLADAEQAARFTQSDVQDWPAFSQTVYEQSQQDEPSPGKKLYEALPETSQQALAQAVEQQKYDEKFRTEMVEGLNFVLAARDVRLYGDDLFDEKNFAGVTLPDAAKGLLRNRGSLGLPQRERLKRLLLEAAYPELIKSHAWETPMRRASNVTSLIGDANLALFISAVVAMIVLYRQRKPSKTEMAKMVEVSLMSGGVIILITAAGGAFGSMLKAAKIGDAIETMFQSGGASASGLMLLLLGFGVAVLLKVAQGSSTVAMITGSAMLAAILAGGTVEMPFHPVYLCTAIGSGSLIGSWMNDSGFWIFAKMGGLTETEALRSWTIMLIALGGVSMIVTVILANVLPMVP